jgi:uncharacterized protein
MFLEQGGKGRNDIGRWVAMILIVAIFSQFIGYLPIRILIFLKLEENGDLQPNPENGFDLSPFDISSIATLVLYSIPYIVGLITLMLLITPIHERKSLSVLTSLPSFRWKNFFWGARIWLMLIASYTLIVSLTGIQENKIQFNFLNFCTLTLYSLTLIPLQTAFQEVLFRGYLMQGFSQIIKFKWLTLLVTALIFGAIQITNQENNVIEPFNTLPQYIWYGIVFGIITLMDEGLEMALGVHTINNIFFSLFFCGDSSVVDTPALFQITHFNAKLDLVALISMSLLFLYIARQKFNWPQWNQLLNRVNDPNTEELAVYLEDEYEDEDYK